MNGRSRILLFLILVTWSVTAGLLALQSQLSYTGDYETAIASALFPFSGSVLILAFSGVLAFALWFSRKESLGIFFPASVVALSFLSGCLMAIPYLRYGAPFDRLDVWVHLTYVEQILQTGGLQLSTDFYPALHVLAASLYFYGGIPSQVGIGLVFPLLASSRVPILALIARRYQGDRAGIVAAGIATVLGVTTPSAYGTPWGFSVVLLDCFLLIIVLQSKETRSRFGVLLVVVGLALVLSHVLTAVAISIAFTLLFFYRLSTRVYRRPRGKLSPLGVGAVFTVLTVAYVFILTRIYLIQGPLIIADLGRSNPLQFQATTSANFTLANVVRVLGPDLAVIGLAIMGIAKNLLRNNRPREGPQFLFAFFLASALILILEESLIRNTPFGPTRPIALAEQAAPVLAVALVPPLLNAGSPDRLVKFARQEDPTLAGSNVRGLSLTLVTVTVCIAFAYGTVTGFPSPYVFNLNPQFTHCESSAVIWLGTAGSGLPVVTDESLSRASFYYSSTLSSWKTGYWGYTNLIPSHLAFNRSQQYPVMILISEHVLQKGGSGFVPNWTI